MPSFTQRIPDLQQIGPVIEVMLTLSVPFIQTTGIIPSAAWCVDISYTGYDNSFTLSF